MIYFDTSYLVRLYIPEVGAGKVRTLAATSQICCSLHGRTELIAALHRILRERKLTRSQFVNVLDQFLEEEKAESIAWLESSNECHLRAEKVYRNAAASTFLRAADAMHLACAAENGLKEIYSNDKHLLAAAPLFGLKPRNLVL